MSNLRQPALDVELRIAVLAVLISLLIGGGLVWLLTSGPPIHSAVRDASGPARPPVPSPQVTPTLPASARVLATDKNGITVVPELAALARQLNAPDSTIERDFEILDTLVEAFRRSNNGAGPPGGENDEIIAQLRGQNPRHLALIPPDLAAINAQGQLMDRWGTPFYFHPVSATLLSIRSAGPDHKLWTSDDVSSDTL